MLPLIPRTLSLCRSAMVLLASSLLGVGLLLPSGDAKAARELSRSEQLAAA